MNVLVTSGGTHEPIDRIRFITNFSTGATGAFIADAFSDLGWSVTHLRAENSVFSPRARSSVTYSTFKELDHEIHSALKAQHYDAVVHAAAVSDYALDQVRLNGQLLSPEEVGADRKLPSDAAMELILRPNPKIISHLKEYSQNKHIKVVGFKLTSTEDNHQRWEAVKKLTFSPHIDYVVQNDISEIIPALNQHKCQIYKQGKCVAQTHTKAELAIALNNHLRETV